MDATSDEALELLLSTFEQICKDFENGITQRQCMQSNCNAEFKKREAIEFNVNSLQSENERLSKLYTKSFSKLADELDQRTSCHLLKEKLKRTKDELAFKENECRSVIESLKQENSTRTEDTENQVRELLRQKAMNEATINQLQRDLAAQKEHIEVLSGRLEQVRYDVKSKYHNEIQDLKDCLLIEQDEKNELNKKLQDVEKECFLCIYLYICSVSYSFLSRHATVLISRTKLVEHQRDLTSNRHVEALKQKIMQLRKENEILKRRQLGLEAG